MEKYVQTGGTRIGVLNVSWPFSKLEVSDGGIIVSVFSKKYNFDKREIKRLSDYRGFFSKGVQIEHTKTNYDKVFIFWSFNQKEVNKNLERLGYNIFSK